MLLAYSESDDCVIEISLKILAPHLLLSGKRKPCMELLVGVPVMSTGLETVKHTHQQYMQVSILRGCTLTQATIAKSETMPLKTTNIGMVCKPPHLL
jgi:hypothetical protein